MADLPAKKRSRKVGSRKDVYDGVSERTAGGLRKEDLVCNEKGRICTKKEIERGKQLAAYMRQKKAEKQEDEAAAEEPQLITEDVSLEEA